MESRYINSGIAASLLGISERAIRLQIESGKFSATKVAGGRGGNSGTAYAIKLDEVLERASVEQRMMLYESQSGITATVSAADLATYKAAFGEKGIAELAERQQAVMALDGILSSGEYGKGKADDGA